MTTKNTALELLMAILPPTHKLQPQRMDSFYAEASTAQEFVQMASQEDQSHLFARIKGKRGNSAEIEFMLSQQKLDEYQELKEQKYIEAHKDDEITEIGIDIETYSPEPLQDCGVYRYAEHPDFDILLFAYSINRGPAQVIDLAQGETLPTRIITALQNEKVLKTAFNAAFERICLTSYLRRRNLLVANTTPDGYLPPEQWDCTMIRCARLSLPLSLARAAEVLNVTRKMEEGKDLIKFFSCPCKPTKKNGGRTRNLPEHGPEKWALYKKYNKRDVEVEQALRNRVTKMEMPAWEQRMWFIDQRINDRGVMIDLNLVKNATRMDEEYKQTLMAEAQVLTGLTNPNSVKQLKEWLTEQTGIEVNSLNKATLPELKEAAEGAADRMLQLRSELGKSSTAKYKAMLDCVCRDGRIRGLLQFCGAVRTGRWSGRLVQVQNLPQNHLADLDLARNLVKYGDAEELQLNYNNAPSVLSELIRTAFIAKPGHTFHVCDFSAIEARVIAWLAGEDWVLEVFRTHGKIYEATASKMYKVPIEEITKTDPRRQKGKIAQLALGYQGGLGALKAMGGERMGLSDDEMLQMVTDWRNANKKIVRLWRHVESAAKATIKTGERTTIEQGITMDWKWGGLLITLPSGRPIYYPRAGFLEDGRICYEGQNQQTKKWGRVETYGGKMTENIVQAIARDCLAVTMARLDSVGLNIVFHIHDECIVEAKPFQKLEHIEGIFKMPISWAPGLPLKGAGYTTPYYLKD